MFPDVDCAGHTLCFLNVLFALLSGRTHSRHRGLRQGSPPLENVPEGPVRNARGRPETRPFHLRTGELGAYLEGVCKRPCSGALCLRQIRQRRVPRATRDGRYVSTRKPAAPTVHPSDPAAVTRQRARRAANIAGAVVGAAMASMRSWAPRGVYVLNVRGVSAVVRPTLVIVGATQGHRRTEDAIQVDTAMRCAGTAG